MTEFMVLHESKEVGDENITTTNEKIFETLVNRLDLGFAKEYDYNPY